MNGIQVNLTNGYSSPLFKGNKHSCPVRELEDLSKVDIGVMGLMA